MTVVAQTLLVEPVQTPKVKLVDVARIVSGGTPKTSVEEYWDGDILWATPKDLSGLIGVEIGTTPRKITPAGLRSCSAELLPANSVLFSSRAPIGLLAINTMPMSTNQGFKSFVPDSSRLDSRYLYRWLEFEREWLQSLGVGATFKEISKTTMSRVELPLPPVPAQRRIAAILDKADHVRTKRREAIANLDALTQSIFDDMFGDLLPDGVLSDAISALIGGKNIVGADDSTNPYRVLKISAVTSGQYLESESKALPSDYIHAADHVVRSGDVIISRANTTELVGASALVDTTNGQTVLPDKLWRAVPTDEVNPHYLVTALQSDRIRAEISSRSTGSGGSMKNISKPKLLSVPIAIPPLKLQQTFARRVAGVEYLKDQHRTQMAEMDTLFASLQHRAFRGEL